LKGVLYLQGKTSVKHAPIRENAGIRDGLPDPLYPEVGITKQSLRGTNTRNFRDCRLVDAVPVP